MKVWVAIDGTGDPHGLWQSLDGKGGFCGYAAATPLPEPVILLQVNNGGYGDQPAGLVLTRELKACIERLAKRMAERIAEGE